MDWNQMNEEQLEREIGHVQERLASLKELLKIAKPVFGQFIPAILSENTERINAAKKGLYTFVIKQDAGFKDISFDDFSKAVSFKVFSEQFLPKLSVWETNVYKEIHKIKKLEKILALKRYENAWKIPL